MCGCRPLELSAIRSNSISRIADRSDRRASAISNTVVPPAAASTVDCIMCMDRSQTPGSQASTNRVPGPGGGDRPGSSSTHSAIPTGRNIGAQSASARLAQFDTAPLPSTSAWDSGAREPLIKHGSDQDRDADPVPGTASRRSNGECRPTSTLRSASPMAVASSGADRHAVGLAQSRFRRATAPRNPHRWSEPRSYLPSAWLRPIISVPLRDDDATAPRIDGAQNSGDADRFAQVVRGWVGLDRTAPDRRSAEGIGRTAKSRLLLIVVALPQCGMRSLL